MGFKIAWEKDWPEAFMFLFLVLGFILAVLMMSPIFTYLTILISGFLAGRIFFIKRYKEPILPFILIIAGFLVGFFLGSFWASRPLILIFFMVAFGLSYYLHKKKILVIFKSQSFLK